MFIIFSYMNEPNKRLEILVIEDDPITANIIKHYLQELYVVRCVDTIKSALDVDLVSRCHVIFSDFVLPDGTALDFLNFISDSKLEKPIIIITKFSNTQIMSDCWKAGAFDFLEKPVSKKQILYCVYTAIHFGPPYSRYSALSNSVVHAPEKRFIDLDWLFQALDQDIETLSAILDESRTEIQRCCSYIKTLYLCDDQANAYHSLQFHLHRLEGVAKNLCADILLDVINDISMAIGRGEQIMDSDMDHLVKTAHEASQRITLYVKSKREKTLSK